MVDLLNVYIQNYTSIYTHRFIDACMHASIHDLDGRCPSTSSGGGAAGFETHTEHVFAILLQQMARLKLKNPLFFKGPSCRYCLVLDVADCNVMPDTVLFG